jgi:CRP-like cAMP-binding protein
MQTQQLSQLLGQPNGDHPIVVRRNDGDHCEATMVEKPRLFSGVSTADYAGICRVARARDFARGEMLYFEDNAVEQLYLLTSGSVKVTKLSPGGENVILRLTVAGDVLGAGCLFSTGTHCGSAEVLRSCRTLVWQVSAFKELVVQFPILHQNMVGILGDHLREIEDRFHEVATGRVGSRVALQLLRLLKTMGRPVQAGIEICLSREELAQMTVTTLFTVSRLLSAWEARGVVRPRREAVAICDVNSLRAISQEA